MPFIVLECFAPNHFPTARFLHFLSPTASSPYHHQCSILNTRTQASHKHPLDSYFAPGFAITLTPPHHSLFFLSFKIKEQCPIHSCFSSLPRAETKTKLFFKTRSFKVHYSRIPFHSILIPLSLLHRHTSMSWSFSSDPSTLAPTQNSQTPIKCLHLTASATALPQYLPKASQTFSLYAIPMVPARPWPPSYCFLQLLPFLKHFPFSAALSSVSIVLGKARSCRSVSLFYHIRPLLFSRCN